MTKKVYLCIMTVKRQIAIVLLVFANIILLTHAVLPHYHHDGVVCFELDETFNNHIDALDILGGCCDSHTEDKSHCHNQSSSEDCDLKSFIIKQADTSLQHNILHTVCCLSLFHYADYYLNKFYLDGLSFGLQQQEKPYLISYITPFVGTISGLRAPPVYFLG